MSKKNNKSNKKKSTRGKYKIEALINFKSKVCAQMAGM